MARAALGELGYPPPQRGYAGQPEPGAPPQQGWAAQPQPGPLPGYAGQPQPGPPPGYAGRQPGGSPGPASGSPANPLDQLGEDLAGMAMGAAARFLGRAASRRAEKAARVLPDLIARRQEMLRTQIAIAERHPDLCACLSDNVIFLAGGSRALPMPNLGNVTVEQADAIAAQLRGD